MYHPGPEQEKAGPLSDLLSLSIYGSLHDINTYYVVEDMDMQGRAFAAYFRQPGRRPSFSGLMCDGHHYPPLAEALVENCAPNLRFLHVLGGDPSVLSHLGTIYQADAFAYLHELLFEDDIRAWMEAVLTSTHKGGALKLLKFEGGEGEDKRDELNRTLALMDGVRRGAYPNVKRFDTRKVNNCSISNFIDAIGEGFPWSRTLNFFS